MISSNFKSRKLNMFRIVKRIAKRSSFIVNTYALVGKLQRRIALATFEIKDIYDSYLSKSTKSQKTPYGFNLVGSKSMHHIAMQRGEFEPEETELFMELFNQSEVFVDVGANIGFYSCLARSMNKHVVVVEPLPKNLSLIYENFRSNAWEDVEIFPVGLSERSGIATLYGASSTGASLIGSWAGASKAFQRTIPLLTLDILIGDRFKGKKIFIKIDVEGAEYSVLIGAHNTLKLDPKPTWVLEICMAEYHPDGMNPDFQNVFDLFWKNGYEVRTANRENKLIKREDVARWVETRICDSGTINYKFYPR